jgi:uncharacterized membrane protein YkvA (DUF1232 family)
MDIWGSALSLAGGLAVVYGVLLVAMWRYSRKHGGVGIKDGLMIMPHVLVLVKRLAFDKSLGRGPRIKLFLLLAFLASPLDIIPDLIPVIGIADDLIIVALVLRSVVKSSGREALERNWPGTEHGLAIVSKLV